MGKYNLTVLLILLIGVLAFISCSSDNGSTKYDYCVYMEKEICLSGSYEYDRSKFSVGNGLNRSLYSVRCVKNYANL